MHNESFKEIPNLPFRAFIFGPTKQRIMCDPHYHSLIEILYGISGKCTVYVNGKKYNFSKGDLIFVSPNEIHSIIAYEPSQYAVLMFYPDILYTSGYDFYEIIYTLPIIMADPSWRTFFSGDTIEKTFIPEAISDACREFTNRNFGFELAVKIQIFKIFLWIIRYYEDTVNTNLALQVSSDDLARLQIVFDYVDENYQNEIGVEDAAKICNLSYNYFSKNFKAITSKSFTEYLSHVRIKASEKLLTTTNKSITEIAQDVGFSTASYYISQFKKHNNVTPSSFRKTYLKFNSIVTHRVD